MIDLINSYSIYKVTYSVLHMKKDLFLIVDNGFMDLVLAE